MCESDPDPLKQEMKGEGGKRGREKEESYSAH